MRNWAHTNRPGAGTRGPGPEASCDAFPRRNLGLRLSKVSDSKSETLGPLLSYRPDVLVPSHTAFCEMFGEEKRGFSAANLGSVG